MTGRLLAGLRIGLLGALLVGAVGVAGHLAGDTVLGGTWLTAALGPTAYVMLAHPRDVQSRMRNGVIGHVVALAAGLFSLAVFRLWDAPSTAETHRETIPQVGAQAVALALTLVLLTFAGAHHAPAAATALLVASGIAAPGMPLVGLVVGLVIVLALAPLLARIPGTRRETAAVDARETPMG